MTYRPRHRSRNRGGCLMRILTFVVLIVILAYPFAEPFMLETETVSLTSDHLPRDVGQLRLVYLSDIHAGSYFSQARVENLVRTINRLNADLVLLGGDYAEDSETAIEFFKHMPAIHSSYGVYGVMGNHDRTIPESNLSRLRSAMIAAGVTPIVNDVTPVRIGASNVYLAGIDDLSNGWPDLTAVSSQVRYDDYVIFLSHNPQIIPEAHKAKDMNGHNMWFDLGLFGHTHGGQIALVGDWLGIAKVDPRYEEGWLVENRTNLLISRGVGTSILPVRLFNQPQLHLITIKSTQ